MTERTYCSQTNPAEPLAGSAPNIDVWLLLEYRPAWNARAQEHNDLSADVREWLDAAIASLVAAGFRPKLQFVRQPEFDCEETRLFVGVEGRLLQFSGVGYGFLAGLDIADITANSARYTALDAPRYFVCTNGQRDFCCARYGLRSYAALRETVGERAWQITHLGGHRFAPNVLVFPDAAMYGRVGEDNVEHFLSVVESGGWDFPRLRGRCRYPGHVQAAEIAAGRQDLTLVEVTGDDHAAQVNLANGSELISVEVRRSQGPQMVVKSCGADTEAVFPYVCKLH